MLCQTFSDFELIIVDDGSDDNTLIEIKKFNDVCVLPPILTTKCRDVDHLTKWV